MRRRNHVQTVYVHFGTFDYWLPVYIGDHDTAMRRIEKYLETPRLADDEIQAQNAAGARGKAFHNSRQWSALWIPRRPRTPDEHATLAHEMFHAVRFMLTEWAGMPCTHDTQEAFAHALGHGVRTVLEKAA